MYGVRSYKRGYIMGADGKFLNEKVTDEIWIEYLKSLWHEEYQIRRDRMLIFDPKGTKSSGEKALPKVVSYDSITDATGDRFVSQRISVEDEVIKNIVYACMYKAIKRLSSEETHLLTWIYLEGMTIRKYAEAYEVPRTTVQYRHKKILSKLKKIMEEDVEFSKDMLPETLEADER